MISKKLAERLAKNPKLMAELKAAISEGRPVWTVPNMSGDSEQDVRDTINAIEAR